MRNNNYIIKWQHNVIMPLSQSLKMSKYTPFLNKVKSSTFCFIIDKETKLMIGFGQATLNPKDKGYNHVIGREISLTNALKTMEMSDKEKQEIYDILNNTSKKYPKKQLTWETSI